MITVYFAVKAIRALGDFVFHHWYIGVLLAGCVIAAATVWGRWRVITARRQAERLRSLRLTLSQLDAMTPTDFERAVRDLMIRDGVSAKHVGQRGDKAADVIGRDHRGQIIVVQCKHTTTGAKVGARVMYEVNGTAVSVHGADYAMVVTNGSFTRDARQMADHFGIRLLGREDLNRWAAGGVPVQRFAGSAALLRRRRLRFPSARLVRRGHAPRQTSSRHG
ncbi:MULTISPECIES: restriction endonuclease [Streptosporangium]|uniref:restriction endonuclease n=1 Tax=Streptosporangium TaxID=2000 RepID=UPI0031F874E5